MGIASQSMQMEIAEAEGDGIVALASSLLRKTDPGVSAPSLHLSAYRFRFSTSF
jgi:hypothetical protein